MSDLIVSFNFDESKKKNRIIIETYEGIIPRLKSKKYSGQLRNVNINSDNAYDNVTSVQLRQIRDCLNCPCNVQINKHQYMIAETALGEITEIANNNCLFYKDKKNGMFQVENILINQKMPQNTYAINEIQIAGEKTSLYLSLDLEKEEQLIHNIETKVYIHVTEKMCPLELLFDYGDFTTDYSNKDRLINSNTYRDYGYEEKRVRQILACGWEYHKSYGFTYVGKDLGKDISRLFDFGISVYTNKHKKIVAADFADIQVSYDLDWFNIKGYVNIDGENVDISQLFHFKKKHENWVEYNGQIILAPAILNSKAITSDKDTGEVIIPKEQIMSAIRIANELNGSNVVNIDSLIDYSDVKLDLDDSIKGLLREYQALGVKWLLSLKRNSFGACLADDMGLGKTLQIIAFLSDRSNDNTRNLIVVPKTLLINWQREFEKFSPDTKLYVYHGANRDICDIKDKKIVITTFQTLVNDFALYEEIQFDNLIVDEAQYVKNARSKAYKALSAIQASMKIILTGTPIENNLAEFWGLMKLINPGIVESYKNVTGDQAALVDKIKRMSAPFLLRRLKKDVLNDLPEKQEQTLLVKMDPEQQELYDTMLESIRYEILRKNDRFEIKSNSIMLNGLLYLQEICCHPQLLDKEFTHGCTQSVKLDLLMDLVTNSYETGHKVVIFSRFTKMLSIIEKKINSAHMNYYYLDGKTKDRMSVVDEFENSDSGIFLISLKAGGIGINLTSADVAIIYDPWWNPASEKQAEDRIYRIGQKRNVIIYRLIVQGTIEEKIQQLQKEKVELCSQILDGHRIPLPLTAELMRQLLLD